MAPDRMPTLFIDHGGGPCFFMEPRIGPKDMWDRLAAHLRGLAATLASPPKAIVVVSGHWEEAIPTVQASEHPPLLFDYYGFPEHTYRLTYPAPGSPEVARRIRDLLGEAGFTTGKNTERGFDHGVFVPFLLAFPDADIPVVQLSLQHELDPAVHLAIGKAITPLRDEGVLIVGSGMSFHNNRGLFADDPRIAAASVAFDNWLSESVTLPDAGQRNQRLMAWDTAPFARFCHPREEHLLPLMVAAGAAGEDAASRDYSDQIMGKALSGFRFG
ncbi:MAG TPA: class III extradiol ring-cleavage dioxygenase [Alphaproteobacteria bacterium]|nr:class III extradiol ring-cleavage dioxygenase [Alphaproteobacteria bacterium]